jgi:PAS domain S-box-containing protein
MAIMGADSGSIQMFDAERGELKLLAWNNFHPEAAASCERVSREAETICGSALQHGDRVIVPDVRAVEALKDTETMRFYSLSGIVAVQSTPLMTREGRLIGMISTHWREVHTPAERELRLLDILARQATDFFERSRAQEALRESEERFRLFVENVHEYALVQTSADGAITSWNPGAERLFGYTTAEMIGKPFLQLMRSDMEEAQALDGEIKQVLKGHRVEDAQWLSRKDDGLFWARWVSEPVYDATGNLRGIARLMRDETDRRQADEAMRNSLAEKEELLKEVHHRVKNNLQVISSLVNLQASRAEDRQVIAAFEETRNRVYSIGTIHELLYRSGSFASIDLVNYARKLVPELIRLYDAHERVRVEIAGDTLTLELERAVPVGLILNELVSNVCKHAFPRYRSGDMIVAFSRNGGSLTMSVSDSGIGLPVGFAFHKASSLGLHLVRNLARQLRATVGVNSENGTTVTVTMPVRVEY